jgi:drug/metabolite transporter (DMT)-like permease
VIRDRSWRLKVAAAFGIVYVVWGSTYLAIRVGVAELPPALFAGARFLAAGALLLVYARLTGQAWPVGAREWKTIAIVAALLLVTANGLVVWGEQWVASNQAALIVATTALWIAGLGALGPHGDPLNRRTVVGLAVGLLGVIVLLNPPGEFGEALFTGQLAILGASISWASGSIYARRVRPRTPPLMSAAWQSLIAGVVLIGLGLAHGEAGHWRWTPASSASLLYLIVFGSCFAYAAYVWLLHEVTPASLGTYAYINPAVAVVLGWWLLDEHLDARQLLGMTVILAGVVMVSTARPRAVVTAEERV